MDWFGVADKPAHAAARCLYMMGLRSVLSGRAPRRGGVLISVGAGSVETRVGWLRWFGFGLGGVRLGWVELVWVLV